MTDLLIKKEKLVPGKIYKIESGLLFGLYERIQDVDSIGDSLDIGDEFFLLDTTVEKEGERTGDFALEYLRVLGVKREFCGWIRTNKYDRYSEVLP